MIVMESGSMLFILRRHTQIPSPKVFSSTKALHHLYFFLYSVFAVCVGDGIYNGDSLIEMEERRVQKMEKREVLRN